MSEGFQFGECVGEQGDVDGVELSDGLLWCMHIFNFLYLVDGVALIILGILGFPEFVSDADYALYAMIGNGCGMILIGLIACCAACTKNYNNSCICILYCLLVAVIILVNGYAIYIFNTVEVEEGQFVYALDGVIVITWLLNAFGYASVLKTNSTARAFMKAVCKCCGEEE